MKAGLLAFLSVPALSLFFGCASVNVSDRVGNVKVEDGLTPIETVEVSNMSWMFLVGLPIAGGDVDNPNGHTCDWFTRSSTLENQLKMLQAEADRVGARRALNVTTLTTDEDFFLFLFLREKIHTSAVLVK